MKIRLFLLLAASLITLSLGSIPSYANDNSETTTLKSSLSEATSRKSFYNNISLFMNVFPVPIRSGGIGLALEYDIGPRVSLWVDADRSVKESSGAFWAISRYYKSTSTNRSASLRYYSSDSERSAWFLGLGYKLTVVDTEARGGNIIEAVVAHKSEKHEGAVASLGYRFQGRKSKYFQWQFDLGATYGPGIIHEVNYVADSQIFFGVDKAHLETDVAYGFSPEARMGVQF